MSMRSCCASHTGVAPRDTGNAVDHTSDSPTSTFTASANDDMFWHTMCFDTDDDANPFLHPKLDDCPAVDKDLLDSAAAGRLVSTGCSFSDHHISGLLPGIASPGFHAAATTEDCNSSGSCACDFRWSAARDLAAFHGVVLRESCPRDDGLDPAPPSLAEQVACLQGRDGGGTLEDLISDSSGGAVEENFSSVDGIEDKEERGVTLVHQLLGCAQAISCGDVSAAEEHVKRLRELISPRGSSMERVATYFTKALSARLDCELRGFRGGESKSNTATVEQKLIAYQMFYRSCPYLITTHFTANQAILEAFEGEEKVHVVDLDIKQGLQWPSLIQALSERPMGPPRLRITGVARDTLDMACLIATKARLLDFADMFRVPLEFTVIKGNLESLQPWTLEIREKEALAVNCVSSLHQLISHPRVSIDSFLLMIHSLEPSVVTIVEQDADHDLEFLPRFINALHYYSSMFDSLAASCISSSQPGSQLERETVEELLLGNDIMEIVGREEQERLARHQPADYWIRLMDCLGFRHRPLSSRSILQADYLLSMYQVSKYCLTNQGRYLSVGWQNKSLYFVSSWCPRIVSD